MGRYKTLLMIGVSDMVTANLHVICGNCGNNEMLSAEIAGDARDLSDDDLQPEVFIRCGNCATLHSLSDNMELTSE